ncbi:protein FAM83D [Rhinophrynus dorsalis]
MANQSQCLDDVPLGGRWPAAPPDQYNEAHRLALEELVSGGPGALQGFLHKERLPGFLSEPEIGEILSNAAAVNCGEDETSMSASADCSSVTYFPDRSDLEPPLLELGWPAFSTGSYRGVTRVEAHFQPSFGDTIYSCKEAARNLIKSAREVIAVVMDSFTDNDLFQDIHEACKKRKVPVYILLDQAHLPHFLTMCHNLGVSLEAEQYMRVRTLTGNNYYTRSGAKIIGKAREKFILVDGLKVGTGSYSFTWTDGKLNSSNMLVMTGQVVEKFDLQFRILYAQSKPINPKLLSSMKTRVPLNPMSYKLPVHKKPTVGALLHMELAKLSSTPKKAIDTRTLFERESGAIGHLKGLDEDWLQNCDVISGLKETKSVAIQTDTWNGSCKETGVDATTQTVVSSSNAGTQTSLQGKVASTQTMVFSRSITTQTIQLPESSSAALRGTATLSTTVRLTKSNSTSSSSSFSSTSSASTSSNSSIKSSDFSSNGLYQSEYPLRDCFKKLTKERQYHYTSIRNKLDHMVSILSRKHRLANSYLNREPGPYGLQRRDVMHSSLLNLRDGVRFAPNM